MFRNSLFNLVKNHTDSDHKWTDLVESAWALVLELLIVPIKIGMCYGQFEAALLKEMGGEDAIDEPPLVNVADHNSHSHSSSSHNSSANQNHHSSSSHSSGKYSSSSGGGGEGEGDTAGSNGHGGPGSLEDHYSFVYHANFYKSTPMATPTKGDSDAHTNGGGSSSSSSSRHFHHLHHNNSHHHHHHHSSSSNSSGSNNSAHHTPNGHAHRTLSAPGPSFSPAVELDTETDDVEILALKGEVELLQSRLDQALHDKVSQ